MILISNSFFKILAQKYPNKALFIPNLVIFILHEIFHFEKFESADFKYNNSFSKLHPKNTQKGNFGPKFKYDNSFSNLGLKIFK